MYGFKYSSECINQYSTHDMLKHSNLQRIRFQTYYLNSCFLVNNKIVVWVCFKFYPVLHFSKENNFFFFKMHFIQILQHAIDQLVVESWGLSFFTDFDGNAIFYQSHSVLISFFTDPIRLKTINHYFDANSHVGFKTEFICNMTKLSFWFQQVGLLAFA